MSKNPRGTISSLQAAVNDLRLLGQSKNGIKDNDDKAQQTAFNMLEDMRSGVYHEQKGKLDWDVVEFIKKYYPSDKGNIYRSIIWENDNFETPVLLLDYLKDGPNKDKFVKFLVERHLANEFGVRITPSSEDAQKALIKLGKERKLRSSAEQLKTDTAELHLETARQQIGYNSTLDEIKGKVAKALKSGKYQSYEEYVNALSEKDKSRETEAMDRLKTKALEYAKKIEELHDKSPSAKKTIDELKDKLKDTPDHDSFQNVIKAQTSIVSIETIAKQMATTQKTLSEGKYTELYRQLAGPQAQTDKQRSI